MSKPYGPNKHTKYQTGEPPVSGWYATKSIFLEKRTPLIENRLIRRFWNSENKTWSLPVMVGHVTNEFTDRVKSQTDTRVNTNNMMYSGLRVPRHG